MSFAEFQCLYYFIASGVVISFSFAMVLRNNSAPGIITFRGKAGDQLFQPKYFWEMKLLTLILNKCPGRDSNSYTFRRHPLKMVRLPISPPGQCFFNLRSWKSRGKSKKNLSASFPKNKRAEKICAPAYFWLKGGYRTRVKLPCLVMVVPVAEATPFRK